MSLQTRNLAHRAPCSLPLHPLTMEVPVDPFLAFELTFFHVSGIGLAVMLLLLIVLAGPDKPGKE